MSHGEQGRSTWRFLFPIALTGAVACTDGTPSGPAPDVPAETETRAIDRPTNLSSALFALEAVASQPLPQLAFEGDDDRHYLADTLRFDIVYAARVPGPLGLARALYLEPDGRVGTEVTIFRYLEDGARVTFPPICVPSEQCPERFREGLLNGRWLTVEVAPPMRGPLRYERVD